MKVPCHSQNFETKNISMKWSEINQNQQHTLTFSQVICVLRLRLRISATCPTPITDHMRFYSAFFVPFCEIAKTLSLMSNFCKFRFRREFPSGRPNGSEVYLHGKMRRRILLAIVSDQGVGGRRFLLCMLELMLIYILRPILMQSNAY